MPGYDILEPEQKGAGYDIIEPENPVHVASDDDLSKLTQQDAIQKAGKENQSNTEGQQGLARGIEKERGPGGLLNTDEWIAAAKNFLPSHIVNRIVGNPPDAPFIPPQISNPVSYAVSSSAGDLAASVPGATPGFRKAVEGVGQSAADAALSYANPDALIGMQAIKAGGALAKTIKAAFSAQIASQAPEAAKAAAEAVAGGDPKEIAKTTTDLAMAVGLPVAIIKESLPESVSKPTGKDLAREINRARLVDLPPENATTQERPAYESQRIRGEVAPEVASPVGSVQPTQEQTPEKTEGNGKTQEKGKINASKITGGEGLDLRQQGSIVGEGTPLQQQGETASEVERTRQEPLGPQSDAASQGEVNGPNVPGESPTVGFGGASALELSEDQSGRDVHGIAQRVRDARAKSGVAAPVQTGEGVNAEGAVKWGQDLLENGADPEAALKDFEKTGNIGFDSVSLTRARGEQLALIASRIESEFGTESPEYERAKKASDDWEYRTKPMATAWHKSGMAMQGEVDIDTGTFTGLSRAKIDSTGKDFTPEQKTQAKEVASKNKKSQQETQAARDALNNHLSEKGGEVSQKVKSLADRITDSLKKAGDEARARIRARGARSMAGLDPVDLADHAILGASKLAEMSVNGAVSFGEWAEEMRKDLGDYVIDHLSQIWEEANKKLDDAIGSEKPIKSFFNRTKIPDAEKQAQQAVWKSMRYRETKAAEAERQASVDAQALKVARDKAEMAASESALKTAKDVVLKNARRTAKEASEQPAKEAKAKLAQSKAAEKSEKDALSAADRMRSNAARQSAKAEADRAVKAAESKAKQSKAAAEAERKAADAVNKRMRESAAAAAKRARKMQDNPELPVWNKAKEYLEKGVTDFDDLRNKVATDLGMKVSEVTRLLAFDKRAKFLADDLWKKQQAERRLKDEAKRWMASLDIPKWKSALKAIPAFSRGIAVFGHGTVGLGTHAPMLLFQPKFYQSYFPAYAKMFKMVGSSAFHEMMMQDLGRRKNYTRAQRAGLVNDPHVYEEYSNPDLAKYVETISPKMGEWLTSMGLAGERGYSVLKILRQDMFDQQWDKLPKHMQTDDMARSLADEINHVTGVTKKGAPRWASNIFFAPRLEASRAAWLVGDPIKAADTFINWKNATDGEKSFAIKQVKEKATVAGMMMSLLYANQAILTSSGSKQKINGVGKWAGGKGFDPMQSDFLKFKVAGMDASYGNSMINLARLPLRLYDITSTSKGRPRSNVESDETVGGKAFEYARTQLHPFASLVTDLALRDDYSGKSLPDSVHQEPKRLKQEGVKPYTWTEFFTEHYSPIPMEEAEKEVWRYGFGFSPQQESEARKALASIAVMGLTGGRITDDWDANSK